MKRTNILVVAYDSAADLTLALREIWEAAHDGEFQISEIVLRAGTVQNIANLQSAFTRHKPHLVLLCADQAGRSQTVELLEAIQTQHWDTPLVLALDAAGGDYLLAGGAADFVVMPFRACDLLLRLRRLLRIAKAGDPLVSELKLKLGLGQLVGESPELVATINQIPKYARCDTAVLLQGETGTGKEMFARAIHYLSPRKAKPFIPINCGAIPAELVENELFGHEPGAFTGASASARGLIAEAEGGTLFLDEIDTLPLQTQVKLLRFLQDHVYRPLGAGKSCGADIRVITASNARLEHAVQAGRFRSDLFYRINVLSLALPPLRERREDIPLLARHFVVQCAREMKIPPKDISPAALHKLASYFWPGNVRELQNIIQRAMILVEENVIRPMDIELHGQVKLTEAKSFRALKARVIEDFERSYLEQLLTDHDGNITQAAQAADKNRRAFWELLRKHHIQLPNRFEHPPTHPAGQSSFLAG